MYFIKSREDEVKRVNPPYIGFILRPIPLKLFLDMVSSSSSDGTRSLGGCFRGIDVEI